MITFTLGRSDHDVTDPARLPEQSWIPAVVPGGVHESLLAAGEIAHPYRDVEGQRWIAGQAWWYRAVLPDPGPDTDGVGRAVTRLVFEGVDTVADFWIDGRHVAHHENQFRPCVLDITDRSAGALLHIRFGDPLADLTVPEWTAKGVETLRALMYGGAEAEQPAGVLSSNMALTRRRKATFSWGWDFAPPVTSIGLIAAVRCDIEGAARLTEHRWRTVQLRPDLSRAMVELTIGAVGDRDLDAAWEVRAEGVVVRSGVADLRRDGLPGERRDSATISITRPKLWWTHDLGDPFLYDLRITLRDSDSGEELDKIDTHVGIRTIDLDRSPDPVAGGRRFGFRLNGVDLFARGANWVPASMMVGSVTDDCRLDLLSRMAEANMNMVRVWGGGVYEPDSFHAACDRLGLLVWQDFMFACADYPDDDPDLMREVIAEAAHHVRRLRDHPSTALWCGNNEAYALHVGMFGADGDTDGWGRHFWEDILPDAVANISPDVPYWAGSPFGPDDPRGPNGVGDGDRHAWEVWHGATLGVDGPTEFADDGEKVHFARYAHDTGKFISEFGIISAADRATLARWGSGDHGTADELLADRTMDTPRDKGLVLLGAETGVPDSAAAYVAMSQAVQAEGMVFGVEHYRRRAPHTAGTLIWQLNESWPGITWSLIDHDHVPKAAYHRVARAYAPVLGSFVENGDTLELWVTNSSSTTVSDTLAVSIRRFVGDADLVTDTVDIAVSAGASTCVWSSAAPVGDDRHTVYAQVTAHTNTLPTNRKFFDRMKNLPLDGRVATTVVSRSPGRTVLSVTAVGGFAYGVRIPLPHPRIRLSDAHIDIPVGGSRLIVVTGPPELLADADLRARSFADDLNDE